MRQMGQEAAGVWQCEIIREDSPHRVETVRAALEWFTTLREVADDPLLCMCCEAEFRWPDALPVAFVFLAPGRDDVSIVSLTGICAKHASLTDAELTQAALGFFRRSFLPDARVLSAANLHSQAGRA